MNIINISEKESTRRNQKEKGGKTKRDKK